MFVLLYLLLCQRARLCYVLASRGLALEMSLCFDGSDKVDVLIWMRCFDSSEGGASPHLNNPATFPTSTLVCINGHESV